MSTASIIRSGITSNVSQKRSEIDFFFEKIIALDGRKIEIDDAIKKLDASILVEINNVNDKLKELKDAYDDRIESGCRSDLFWRVVGTGTEAINTGYTNQITQSTRTYHELKCVRISPNSYPPISLGPKQYTPEQQLLGAIYGYSNLPPLDDGTTMKYITPSGISSTKINSLLAMEADNFFGLKYYDQPYAKDILDTFVSSFVGVVGSGSTEIKVLQLQSSGVTSSVKPGQLVICNKTGVFSSGVGSVAGIGTTLGSVDYTVFKEQAFAISSVTSSGVSSVIVIDGGFGYSDSKPPIVFISPPPANVAIASATINDVTRSISSLSIVNPGSGYTFAPTVQISLPPVSTAVGVASIISGSVDSIEVVFSGIGYTVAPDVVVGAAPSGGTNATATAYVSAGIVTSIEVDNPGAGYTVAPTVTIDPPVSIGASAIAYINSTTGIVTGLTLTNPGYGYTSGDPPSISFTLPSVVGASATAIVSSAGTVTSVSIANSGIGYTTAPTVTIASPFTQVLPVVKLFQPVSIGASAPESDGSLVTFTVLSSQQELNKTPSEISIPFGINPYSPETIGIMKTTDLGIGVDIRYDNSGAANAIQSWRPELKSDAISYNGEVLAEAVTEPNVGAGKIYYKIGFPYKPRKRVGNSWVDAQEGDEITVTSGASGEGLYSVYSNQIGNIIPLKDYVVETSSCSSSITNAIDNALSAVNSAKTAIQNGIDNLNIKINASNLLRKERNDINIQIWGQRQLLGQLYSEIESSEQTLTALNNTNILDTIQ